MPGLVDNRFNLIAVVREALSVSPQRLANGLFLEDRCALPDQTSLFSASDGRAFVLADGDWDSADKSEVAIFVSGITANDPSRGSLLNGNVAWSSSSDQSAGPPRFGSSAGPARFGSSKVHDVPKAAGATAAFDRR